MKGSTYQLLPPLAGDDLERLKASIAERGVEVPVVVDEEGAIIDGHNRAMIADSLGVGYPTVVRAGLSSHEKRLLAVELNMARRQLTDAQKVALGRAIEPDVAAVARQRQGTRTDLQPSGKTSGRLETRDIVAEKVGIGTGRTYQAHKAVLKEAEEVAPELVPYVEAGEITMKELKRELLERRPNDAPAPVVAPRALANVPPHVRKVSAMAHQVTQRVRGLRAQHGSGQLALGIEGRIFAEELETLRDELDGFARELRAAMETTSGGTHGRTAS